MDAGLILLYVVAPLGLIAFCCMFASLVMTFGQTWDDAYVGTKWTIAQALLLVGAGCGSLIGFALFAVMLLCAR